jgi:hypothetical protein
VYVAVVRAVLLYAVETWAPREVEVGGCGQVLVAADPGGVPCRQGDERGAAPAVGGLSRGVRGDASPMEVRGPCSEDASRKGGAVDEVPHR